MNVYFDLNVFDRIEKKDSLTGTERKVYNNLDNLLIENQLVVPYSNAHINDLFRGFQKNPNYIEGHLNNIKRLTKNLCICQYWNRKEVTWHYRDVFEFFEETKQEWEFEPASLDELFDGTGLPNLLLPFKHIELQKEWKLAYREDSMFGVIFPKSKIENTAYALMEDIYNFQVRLKSDYSLYKNFKTYLIKSISTLKNNQVYIKSMKEKFKDLPKHLDIFEITDLYAPNNDSLKNRNYSKVLDVFYKYDLKGYKTDGNFNNMFDDSLHTYYAANCDFFVTNDDRCKYKAEKTYERLNIKTKVIKAIEYETLKESL